MFQCAIQSQCLVYIVYCTLYHTQCRVYIIEQILVCILQGTVYTQCTGYSTVQIIGQVYSVQYNLQYGASRVVISLLGAAICGFLVKTLMSTKHLMFSCSSVQSIQCSAVQCSPVQYSAVQGSSVQCSEQQFRAVQCGAVCCSALQCTVLHYIVLITKLEHHPIISRNSCHSSIFNDMLASVDQQFCKFYKSLNMIPSASFKLEWHIVLQKTRLGIPSCNLNCSS